MLDSPSRLPRAAPIGDLDWEESTFTRPMRSPFATPPSGAARVVDRGSAEVGRRESGVEAVSDPKRAREDVEVSLEEAALFDPPTMRLPVAARLSSVPPPRPSP